LEFDTDLRTLTERQLAELLVASVAELGDEQTTNTLPLGTILAEVEMKTAVIVAENDAIALVRPERKGNDATHPVLWLLFVKARSRRQGTGKAFVMTLRSRFE